MKKLFNFILCMVAIFLVCSCETLGKTNLEFCYKKEDGQEYCGKIGINQQETQKNNSIVLDEKKNGETKTLYTLDKNEVSEIVNKLEASQKTQKAKTLYHPYQRLKKILAR